MEEGGPMKDPGGDFEKLLRERGRKGGRGGRGRKREGGRERERKHNNQGNST